MLAYAAASATINRNGYREMGLRQEIEEARAQTALLRYQIHLAESSPRVQGAAARLGMVPADPVREVDYVLLRPLSEEAPELAAVDATEGSASLATALAELAAGVVSSAGGCAEASTDRGHRP